MPAYRRYAAGAAASNVGTWMHRVGQAWLILAVTGQASMLGVAMALQFGPMLLLSPWAGSLADRWDRRRLLILTQSALGLQAAALGVLVLLSLATAPVLMASALVLGVISAIDAPARQAIVSDLVPRGQVVNAVSLNSASFNAARLVGPALAGLIIAAAGAGWVFLLNALTFTTMLAALMTLRIPAAAWSPNQRTGVREGLRHIRSRRDLVFVMALVGLVAMFALNYQMTIAVMATDEFQAGPVTFGVLASAMAIGSLAGSLLTARRGRTSLRIITVAAAGLGLATALAGLMPTTWLFGAMLVACGITALTMMTAANSYLQTHAGEGHRGRVMAVYLAVFFGTTPIGAPLIGWLAEAAGPRPALVLPGLLALISAALLAWWYRRGGARPSPAPA